jgi:hypothetical protein
LLLLLLLLGLLLNPTRPTKIHIRMHPLLLLLLLPQDPELLLLLLLLNLVQPSHGLGAMHLLDLVSRDGVDIRGQSLWLLLGLLLLGLLLLLLVI